MSDDVPAPLRAAKITTNMTLTRASWLWLKDKAQDKALRDGGQPSMAAVVEDLVRGRMDT
jgi:hypothetical protein